MRGDIPSWSARSFWRRADVCGSCIISAACMVATRHALVQQTPGVSRPGLKPGRYTPRELPPAWIGQIRVLGYGFTSQAGAVGRPALGSGIRSEAPLAPSLATFDRPARGRDTT
jgi:hypothetical protein